MTLTDIANIAIAITSIVAICLSAFTFWHQNRQSKTFLGINILSGWEAKFFESNSMRKRRYITAHHFKYTPEKELPAEAWEILDAFDLIGFYVNRNIINTELAWNTFYYWLNFYWHLLSPHVEEFNAYTNGIPYLKNVHDMYIKLTHFGRNNCNIPDKDIQYAKDKIDRFLIDEIKTTTEKEWEVHLSRHKTN